MKISEYKQFYSKLNNRFLLLSALSILFFVPSWMYVENQNNVNVAHFLSSRTEMYVGLASIVISLVFISLWHFQYHKGLDQLDISEVLFRRLERYQTLFLTLILKITALSILISIGFLFVKAEAMIAAYAICLVLISMNRLTPQRLVRQTKMKGEEKTEFYEGLGI